MSRAEIAGWCSILLVMLGITIYAVKLEYDEQNQDWSQIRDGLSAESVLKALGQPKRFSGYKHVYTWYYRNGYVRFEKRCDCVYDWQQEN